MGEVLTDGVDRDRGILTKSDRQFLLGQKQDLSEQGIRDARYRIRERVRNGIIDFRFLDAIPLKDRRLIFEKLDIGSLPSVFTFLFKGVFDESESLEEGKADIESLIEAGLIPVLKNRDDEHIIQNVSVEITVDRTQPDLEEVERRYRQGEETLDELQYLRRNDRFEGDHDLLAARLLQHVHDDGELPEGLENAILNESDYETVEEYFADVNKRIAEEENIKDSEK